MSIEEGKLSRITPQRGPGDMNGEFVHAAAENCQGQVELLFEGEVDKKERLEGGIRTKCSRTQLEVLGRCV